MTSLSPMLWVVCVAIKDQITCTEIEVLHQGDNVKYQVTRIITGFSGLSTQTGAREFLFEEATHRRKTASLIQLKSRDVCMCLHQVFELVVAVHLRRPHMVVCT